MAEKTTVVTAERFAQGLAYSDYLAQIKVNQDRFSMYDDTAMEAVSDEDADFFKSAVESGCSRVVVVGEDWCPDVYRGMPVIGRIAAVSGMEMRVFPRDENLDIADEFLNRGEFRSIPPWSSTTPTRSTCATGSRGRSRSRRRWPTSPRRSRRRWPVRARRPSRDARRDRVNARFPDWQKESVKDIRALISQTLGI